MGSVNADGTDAVSLDCPSEHAFSLTYTNAVGTGTEGFQYLTDAETGWNDAINGGTSDTYTNSVTIAMSNGTYSNSSFYAVDLYGTGTAADVGNGVTPLRMTAAPRSDSGVTVSAICTP